MPLLDICRSGGRLSLLPGERLFFLSLASVPFRLSSSIRLLHLASTKFSYYLINTFKGFLSPQYSFTSIPDNLTTYEPY